MHEQNIVRGQIDQELLGATAEACNALALQALGKILGQRPTQIRPPNLDTRNTLALHGRFKPATDGFDFWKLGHC